MTHITVLSGLPCVDSHPDAFPNNLTPADSKLHLVDAGHAINIGCPPVLRPQRGVDVILSLSYSWDPQDVLQVNSKGAAILELCLG